MRKPCNGMTVGIINGNRVSLTGEGDICRQGNGIIDIVTNVSQNGCVQFRESTNTVRCQQIIVT